MVRQKSLNFLKIEPFQQILQDKSKINTSCKILDHNLGCAFIPIAKSMAYFNEKRDPKEQQFQADSLYLVLT